jgi:hydroxymethylpyrimidine pyrophosphatase-like HAD family hydrolase
MTSARDRSLRHSSTTRRRQFFLALAADGDGTLVRGDRMSRQLVRAFRAFRRSGRKTLLVTGETISQVEKFPHFRLFDCVVAENGAVLYWPRTRRKRSLCGSPPRRLLRALHEARYRAIRRGHTIISFKRADPAHLAEVLRPLRLDWHLIKNRHAVMLLPSGIDKTFGLDRALKAMRVPAARVVALGDAENDCCFLAGCGLSVAVANAKRRVKTTATLTTRKASGQGVVDIIHTILRDERELSDLAKSRKKSGSKRAAPAA